MDDHGLDVRRGLTGDAVALEGDVAGREDAALGPVDVRALHEGEVAGGAAEDRVHVVLDAAGVGAGADPDVSRADVGVVGHQQDLGALLLGQPRELRELHVVTDGHGHRAAVGLEDVHVLAAGDTPPLLLGGRDVDLVLLVQPPIPVEEVGDVVEDVVLDGQVGPAEDVDVVLDRHPREELEVLGRVLVEGSRRHAGATGGQEPEELVGEELGEEQQVHPVLAGGLHEELALLGEVLEGLDGAHLVLDRRHPALLGQVGRIRGRVERVEELHQDRVAPGLLVLREVVPEDRADHEPIGELGGEDRVGQLLGHDLLHVLPGVHGVGVLGVAGDAAGDHDLAQLELFHELHPRLVDPARQAHAAGVGVHHDVDAVEEVALRVVVREVAARADLLEGVLVLPLGGVEDERAGARHELAVELDADLALGEGRQVVLQVLFAPGHQVGEAAVLDLLDGFEVVQRQGADDETGFALGRIGHAALSCRPRRRSARVPHPEKRRATVSRNHPRGAMHRVVIAGDQATFYGEQRVFSSAVAAAGSRWPCGGRLRGPWPASRRPRRAAARVRHRSQLVAR